VQLPECIAVLPALTVLMVQDNLLTELPPLPSTLELDVSSNRLKRLNAEPWVRMTALTSLSAVGAFSHRPYGESHPAIGALAGLVDGDVAELVKTRSRSVVSR